MNRLIHRFACLVVLLSVATLAMPGVAVALSWEDLWQTPDQQKRTLEQSGDYRALVEDDSTAWQGVGHFRSGDYAAAAESYGQSYGQSGDLDSLYNRATALTRAGEYDAAIEKFDEVLSQDPAHIKAAQNLDIARQLQALQQQNQQQNQDQEGDSGQQDQQQQEQDQQQQEQDQQDESSGQQDESPESGSGDQSEAEESEQSQGAESEQPEEQREEQQGEQQDEQQEQQQQQQAQQEQGSRDQQGAESSVTESEEPLSEDQQAIEQWLRKIPDDPSGLLRRKLLRSHRTDYPDIRDSQSPW